LRGCDLLYVWLISKSGGIRICMKLVTTVHCNRAATMFKKLRLWSSEEDKSSAQKMVAACSFENLTRLHGIASKETVILIFTTGKIKSHIKETLGSAYTFMLIE
jgi:hypothetical protein